MNVPLNLNGKKCEQISVLKLLGIIMTEDLKYEENTNHICKEFQWSPHSSMLGDSYTAGFGLKTVNWSLSLTKMQPHEK